MDFEHVQQILYEERYAWGKQFGGGMIVFDSPWIAAIRAGKTESQAVADGAEALLDAYTERLRKRLEKEYADAP